ncbi:ead/Ea22-like family protein [Klebsiella pneumoniae]|uniref:ead/Ea22-like family protein n=1 Tax=Klebsiella pneumoniae TaxID=573 RepID=UPI003F65D071
MTDITELAQRLKAAAEKWQEAWDKYDKVEITIAEFIRAANQYESIVKDPANVLALVEALEKAQKRISQLESRTVKLPEPFKLAKSSSGLTYYYADEVDAALTAAGIKVEAE